MSRSTYPLAVAPMREYEGPRIGWYSRGHHQESDFLSALMADRGDRKEPDDDFQHETWKYIPDQNGGYFAQVSPGTRGSFPATVLYTGRRSGAADLNNRRATR